MLMTSQLKVGTAFMYEGNPLIVQKMLGQRSGRAGMVTSLRVKNLVTNSTMDLGIDAGEKFDEVDLESHVTKLSYIDGETFVFMDQDTYEQFELAKEDFNSPDFDEDTDVVVVVTKDYVPSVGDNAILNLTGNILKGDLKYTVSIDPSFDEPDAEDKDKHNIAL